MTNTPRQRNFIMPISMPFFETAAFVVLIAAGIIYG